MNRRTLAIIALGGFALVAVAAVGAFAWLNAGALRTMTADALREATGRDVRVETATLALAWPPSIRVTNLHIGNAPWAAASAFAEIPLARATLDAGALLQGDVRPTKVYAEGATIHLARNAAGAWNLPGGGSSGGAGTGLPALELQDATLQYTSPARTDPVQIAFAAFRTVSDAEANRIRITVGSSDTVTVEASHATLQSLLRADGPTSLALEVRAADNRLSFQGEVAPAVPSASGQFDLDMPAPDALAKAFPLVPAQLPATTLSARLTHEPSTWRLEDIKSEIAGQPISGHLTLALRDEERPKLGGELTLPDWPVPLDAICGRSGDAGGISLNALLTGLPPWLIELKLTVDRLRCDDKPAGRLAANLRWSKGTLYYDILELEFLTGAFTASGEITPAAGASPTVTVDGHVRDLSLAAIADMLGAGDTPLAGHIHGRTDLTTTLAAGLGGASGRIALFMRDGVLPRRIIERATLDIGSLTVAEGPDRAKLRCAAGEMRLKKGQGSLKVLVVRTPNALVVVDGSVNFAERTMALRIQADSDNVAFLDLSVPIRVEGPFSDLTVSVDTSAALVQGGAKALIGLVGAPLAAIASFLGETSDTSSQCDLGQQEAAG